MAYYMVNNKKCLSHLSQGFPCTNKKDCKLMTMRLHLRRALSAYCCSSLVLTIRQGLTLVREVLGSQFWNDSLQLLPALQTCRMLPTQKHEKGCSGRTRAGHKAYCLPLQSGPTQLPALRAARLGLESASSACWSKPALQRCQSQRSRQARR